MKKILLILSAIYCLNLSAQNLNLEFASADGNISSNWSKIGSQKGIIRIDPENKRENKNSLLISSEMAGDFNGIAFSLPKNYAGKEIKLSAYVKTEKIDDGHAALWLRIDPKIAFDNMQDRGIKGNTNWTKYEITLPLKPELTEKVVVGAFLTGSGKMWINDLKISIDGNDIANATIFKSNLKVGEANKALDKIIDVTQKISIYKKNVNWNELIPQVKSALKTDVNSLYSALRPPVQLLFDKLNDDHSHLIYEGKYSTFRANAKDITKNLNLQILEALSTGENKIKSEKLSENIGYIAIPAVSINLDDREKKQTEIGQIIRDELCKLNTENLKGIIVDLRLNTGGNMYPMIGGIGPLLGNGVAGYFLYDGKVSSSWKIKDGNVAASTKITNNCTPNKAIKIAVLIGPATASSGEATAISFIGKPNVKVIGENSAGYTSANNDIKISENLYLLLASSYEADRNKKEYKDFITPDILIKDGDNFKDLSQDKKVQKAIEWINQ